jgi:hypothetical protein
MKYGLRLKYNRILYNRILNCARYLLPELEAQRLLSGGAEGHVAVGAALQVGVPQLSEVSPHHLVRVHIDHLVGLIRIRVYKEWV